MFLVKFWDFCKRSYFADSTFITPGKSSEKRGEIEIYKTKHSKIWSFLWIGVL